MLDILTFSSLIRRQTRGPKKPVKNILILVMIPIITENGEVKISYQVTTT